MNAPPAPPGRDAAWVVLECPLPPSELAAFCSDLETLYRINPFLEIRSWIQRPADAFQARLRNHSNGQDVVLDGRVTRETAFAFRIEFASGLKSSTRLTIESCHAGSRLTITDEYRASASASPPPQSEVDRSLHGWGLAIREHLEREGRWGWVPFYRALMRRVWLPMTPAARRITFLVLVIGLADIALVALGFAIYWLEMRR